jgi:hypothetical protein
VTSRRRRYPDTFQQAGQVTEVSTRKSTRLALPCNPVRQSIMALPRQPRTRATEETPRARVKYPCRRPGPRLLVERWTGTHDLTATCTILRRLGCMTVRRRRLHAEGGRRRRCFLGSPGDDPTNTRAGERAAGDANRPASIAPRRAAPILGTPAAQPHPDRRWRSHGRR